MKPIELIIKKMPKAELHLHIEGTLEPNLMFKIAKRNKIKLKYRTIEQVKKAYNFSNLQEFLDIYYESCKVLVKEKDFYDLTYAYLKKAHGQNVIHAEIFFDPQTHTERGIKFSTVINGIHRACVDAKKKMGITTKSILCFLRHLDQKSAFEALEQALPYKKWIVAVGLDSGERGNPPSKFKKVYAKARKNGFLAVAHAGEEGPAEYVWEALRLLKVSRIDHGNHCLDDEKLVQTLAKIKMPLTVCPLSNLKLRVVKDLKQHPLRKMIERGLTVTINSDDPAYFGGYVNENYLALNKAIGLTKGELHQLAKNSFEASFLSEKEKREIAGKVEKIFKAD
ncbi:MAG: adenosine deaminase [Candidatus Micrarchaeota archaeon]